MAHQNDNQVNLIGLLLIVLGALFLLDTFTSLDFGRMVGDWWPVIFIIVGLIKLKGQNRGGAITFIIIGVLLLLLTKDILEWHDIGKFWPLILIIIGLSLVFKGRGKRWNIIDESTVGTDYIHSNAIFGGAEHLVNSQNFKGGEATALFGGVELDMREAKLSPDGCKINVTALFGGVELMVPKDWKVIVSGTPIFGGIDNKSRGDAGKDLSKEVYLHCTVLFGGVEIK